MVRVGASNLVGTASLSPLHQNKWLLEASDPTPRYLQNRCLFRSTNRCTHRYGDQFGAKLKHGFLFVLLASISSFSDAIHALPMHPSKTSFDLFLICESASHPHQFGEAADLQYKCRPRFVMPVKTTRALSLYSCTRAQAYTRFLVLVAPMFFSVCSQPTNPDVEEDYNLPIGRSKEGPHISLCSTPLMAAGVGKQPLSFRAVEKVANIPEAVKGHVKAATTTRVRGLVFILFLFKGLLCKLGCTTLVWLSDHTALII